MSKDIRLRTADYTATLSRRAAAVTRLRHRGRDLLVPFGGDIDPPDYSGIIAAPWPNRIRDGRYAFDGHHHELPVNEAGRRCALHGLAFQEDWTLESRTDASAALSLDLPARPGYPFALRLTAHYRLTERGLTSRVRAVNVGLQTAPYGVCPHPYLVAGPGRLDDWILQLSADTFLAVTHDRLLPTARCSVVGHEFDFRTARPIGSTMIDHAFTDVVRGVDGAAGLTLLDPSGAGVGMAWGPELPWVQIHTSDVPLPRVGRRGLAVEPMTCPPDAFNSGTDLVRLSPGGEHDAEWRIFGLDAP